MGDRRTTIIDQSKPAGKQVQSKTAASLPKSFISTDKVKDPEQLAALLTKMQDDIASATLDSRQNPHAAPCIIRNVQIPNQALGKVILRHTLNRPFTGYWVCRSQGATITQLFEEPISLWPPGLTPSNNLVLLVTTTGGTYDFCVTGD